MQDTAIPATPTSDASADASIEAIQPGATAELTNPNHPSPEETMTENTDIVTEPVTESQSDASKLKTRANGGRKITKRAGAVGKANTKVLKAKAGNKAPATKKTKEQVIAEMEERLVKKYKHAVPGTLQEGRGRYEGKMTIEIECTHKVDGKKCGEHRRIATSDLFQVTRCVAHTEEHRAATRRKNAKAARQTAKA